METIQNPTMFRDLNYSSVMSRSVARSNECQKPAAAKNNSFGIICLGKASMMALRSILKQICWRAPLLKLEPESFGVLYYHDKRKNSNITV